MDEVSEVGTKIYIPALVGPEVKAVTSLSVEERASVRPPKTTGTARMIERSMIKKKMNVIQRANATWPEKGRNRRR